jgi:hypothetical protein
MDAKLTVPLPPELHAFVAREAEREDRSMASVVRRAVAEAAARRERSTVLLRVLCCGKGHRHECGLGYCGDSAHWWSAGAKIGQAKSGCRCQCWAGCAGIRGVS